MSFLNLIFLWTKKIKIYFKLILLAKSFLYMFSILMPLFDPDTNMLFLAGKGDTTIMYMEVMDKDPYLVEGIRHSGEQTKGVCLVSKRALNVMQAEVNRLLQLTSNMVIPIMYQVPRKVSYVKYRLYECYTMTI